MKSLKAKSCAASPNVQRYFFRLFVPIRIQVRDITSKYSKFAIEGKISRSGIIEIALHITFPGLLSLAQIHGKSDCSQDGDDDDHEQLDQGKTMLVIDNPMFEDMTHVCHQRSLY